MGGESYGDVAAACQGKHRFESARLANEVAKRRNRRGKTGEAYRCPHCHYWHIGFGRKLKKPGRR